MTQAPTAGPRPRRWWLAFLLNLVFAPAGYAYAGAWFAVAVVFLVVTTVPMILMIATLQYPPGFYGLGLGGMFALSAAVLVGLATHGAWLSTQRPAKTGSRLAHAGLYALVWLAGIGSNLVMRAWWPNPTYSTASSAMAPSVRPDDIVMVDGARAECGHAGLKPGQVVVFRRQGQAVPYLNRIVAGPGQTVALNAGRLVVDGKPVARKSLGAVVVPDLPVRATLVQETLANGATYRTYDFGPDGALDQLAPTTVPARSWYLLGDNRDNSADSRVHGPIPGRDICAVGLKVVFAKDKSRVGQSL